MWKEKGKSGDSGERAQWEGELWAKEAEVLRLDTHSESEIVYGLKNVDSAEI